MHASISLAVMSAKKPISSDVPPAMQKRADGDVSREAMYSSTCVAFVRSSAALWIVCAGSVMCLRSSRWVSSRDSGVRARIVTFAPSLMYVSEGSSRSLVGSYPVWLVGWRARGPDPWSRPL
jgi:hypothetical protein